MEKETEKQKLIAELNQLSDNFEKNKDRMKYISHLIVENLLHPNNSEWETNVSDAESI